MININERNFNERKCDSRDERKVRLLLWLSFWTGHPEGERTSSIYKVPVFEGWTFSRARIPILLLKKVTSVSRPEPLIDFVPFEMLKREKDREEEKKSDVITIRFSRLFRSIVLFLQAISMIDSPCRLNFIKLYTYVRPSVN